MLFCGTHRDVEGQAGCITAIKAAMPAMVDAGMSVKYGKKVLGKLERAVEVHHQLQPDSLDTMPLEDLQVIATLKTACTYPRQGRFQQGA